MSEPFPPSPPAAADAAPPAPMRAAPALAALVALGFAVRLGACLLKAVVATDSYHYVRIARMIAAGNWHDAISNGYHPAFPTLGALAGATVGDAATGLTAVSLLLGAFTVVPSWSIGRRLAGDRGAFFAALLAAVHPGLVDVGSDILVEATFLFFLVSAAALVLRTAGTLDPWSAAGAGFCAGAAFLTRPEGLVVPAAAAPFLLLAPGLLPRFAPRRWLAAAVLGVVFAATVLPYAVAVRAVFGRWMLTPKSGGAAFHAGAQQAAAGESQRRVKEAAKRSPLYLPWTFLRKFGESLFWPFALAVIGAAFVPRGPPAGRAACVFLLALLALYLPPLLHLLWAASYISTRHLLGPAVLLLLATAPVACAAVTPRLPRLRLVVLLIAAIALPKSLRPERREEIGLKQAGLWLREHAPGEPVAGAEKVAYYADVVQFKVPLDPARVPAHMDEIRARWLALVEDDHRGLAARLGPEFTIVAVFGEGDDRVSVIRYSP